MEFLSVLQYIQKNFDVVKGAKGSNNYKYNFVKAILELGEHVQEVYVKDFPKFEPMLALCKKIGLEVTVEDCQITEFHYTGNEYYPGKLIRIEVPEPKAIKVLYGE